MRVASGKGNDARKILTYYRVNYSIQPPYRVLCDGALIHHALSKKLYLRDSLPVLLKATAQAVVTRCVHEELRALGEPTEAAAMFAKRLTRIPCVHGEGTISAVECVAATLRNGNPRGYFIATNDAGLRKLLRREPGVPVVRIASDGKFVLVPPSKATLDQVGEMEARKAGVQRPDELKKVEEIEQKRIANRMERSAKRAATRKRPKGPNPLSVKKSKKARVSPRHARDDSAAVSSGNGPAEASDGEEGDATGAAQDATDAPKRPNRVRKRKPKTGAQHTPSPAPTTAGATPDVVAAASGGEEAVVPIAGDLFVDRTRYATPQIGTPRM
jgi:U3 small nucleolar RNA-associated protein 23